MNDNYNGGRKTADTSDVMTVKRVLKTLLIFLGVYAICIIILVIFRGIIVTAVNAALLETVTDDMTRMGYANSIAALSVVPFFFIIYFIMKYRFIVNSHDFVRRFEGVVPTPKELFIDRLKAPQNVTELIAFAAFLLLFFFSSVIAAPLLAIPLLLFVTAIFFAADILIDYLISKKWLDERMRI